MLKKGMKGIVRRIDGSVQAGTVWSFNEEGGTLVVTTTNQYGLYYHNLSCSPDASGKYVPTYVNEKAYEAEYFTLD
jgi:hypothetical protein